MKLLVRSASSEAEGQGDAGAPRRAGAGAQVVFVAVFIVPARVVGGRDFHDLLEIDLAPGQAALQVVILDEPHATDPHGLRCHGAGAHLGGEDRPTNIRRPHLRRVVVSSLVAAIAAAASGYHVCPCAVCFLRGSLAWLGSVCVCLCLSVSVCLSGLFRLFIRS